MNWHKRKHGVGLKTVIPVSDFTEKTSELSIKLSWHHGGIVQKLMSLIARLQSF